LGPQFPVIGRQIRGQTFLAGGSRPKVIRGELPISSRAGPFRWTQGKKTVHTAAGKYFCAGPGGPIRCRPALWKRAGGRGKGGCSNAFFGDFFFPSQGRAPANLYGRNKKANPAPNYCSKKPAVGAVKAIFGTRGTAWKGGFASSTGGGRTKNKKKHGGETLP